MLIRGNGELVLCDVVEFRTPTMDDASRAFTRPLLAESETPFVKSIFHIQV